MDGTCSTHETKMHAQILVGKPEGKRPPESPRRRWEDNSKIDLKETGCEDVNWI
jgi:hypothetical protein